MYVCTLYYCVDDQDEEATISEQEQMEDDNENADEVQQLSKEGMHMDIVRVCVCMCVHGMGNHALTGDQYILLKVRYLLRSCWHSMVLSWVLTKQLQVHQLVQKVS